MLPFFVAVIPNRAESRSLGISFIKPQVKRAQRLIFHSQCSEHSKTFCRQHINQINQGQAN